MSIVFRDRDESLDSYSEMDIMLINKDRKIIVNPLEDLDDEEKLAVLTDLINSDPMQGEFKIQIKIGLNARVSLVVGSVKI